ncbi:MAG: response regulator transcription factor [Acidimicrobiaceae bacterium]|nr:response regulator transcription factor [Acidimicrobiaceae bacterium]
MVVEDDPSIADLLNSYLSKEGYRVLLASQGKRALELFRQEKLSLIVLDVGLPGDLDGLEVCKAIRQTSQVPIIMLTARDSEIDKVLGLELGADDYVTKPFSPRELTSRVKAILRRSTQSAEPSAEPIRLGEIQLDLKTREVFLQGEPIPMTVREFDLLSYLFRNRRLALNRRQLLDGVWGVDWYGDDRTVDVHVRQLRRKLKGHLPLTTVWGVGYRLD